jgi:alkanesulfonate monooxygenase SsuD/methylene tetrahydromethanopterin reductase-like flavin-dependent oxidoreductase (luciferase family)
MACEQLGYYRYWLAEHPTKPLTATITALHLSHTASVLYAKGATGSDRKKPSTAQSRL